MRCPARLSVVFAATLLLADDARIELPPVFLDSDLSNRRQS